MVILLQLPSFIPKYSDLKPLHMENSLKSEKSLQLVALLALLYSLLRNVKEGGRIVARGAAITLSLCLTIPLLHKAEALFAR